METKDTDGNVLLGPLTFTVTTTPEPATFAMIAFGLIAIALFSRRFSAVRT